MTNWLLQHFRLSFMSASEPARKLLSDDVSDGLFRDVWGVDVDSEEKKRAGLVRRRQGSLDSCRIEVVEQPTRLDIMWMSNISLEMASIEGDMSQAALTSLSEIGNFLEVYEQICSKLSDVSRVALGGIAFSLAETTDEAYRVIASYVPKLNIDYGVVKDFALQINRSTDINLSEGQKIQLNRLSCLNAMASKILMGRAIENISGVQETNWAQMQFDINTDANFKDHFSAADLNLIKNDLLSGLRYVFEQEIG